MLTSSSGMESLLANSGLDYVDRDSKKQSEGRGRNADEIAGDRLMHRVSKERLAMEGPRMIKWFGTYSLGQFRE